MEAVPYRLHTVLTDNRRDASIRPAGRQALPAEGVQFTRRKQDIWDGEHIFDCVCDEHGIAHRLTKVNHPGTNGQVERMNRTIKDDERCSSSVKRYH